MPTRAETALARVRKACLALPGTTERASHGSPAWFVKKTRQYVAFVDNHHGDGRLALWCCAPPGAQAMLVESFVGEAIDKIEPEEIREALRSAARQWLAKTAS